MELIRKDIIELKEKADVERLKIKRDEKIQSLEKQRDWFRDEALAQNKENKANKHRLNQLKMAYRDVSEERVYFQTLLNEEREKYASAARENIQYKFGLYH